MKMIHGLMMALSITTAAHGETQAPVRIAFSQAKPALGRPAFESPFAKTASADSVEGLPPVNLPAPRLPEEQESPENVKRLTALIAQQNTHNEARILEVLGQIRALGPDVNGMGYSRAEVAVLAELGDYLKELTNRRERFRRVAAFLETPHLNRLVDESSTKSPGRELASDKAERYESLGLQSAPNLKHLRHFSRTQLAQRAKELNSLMSRQRNEWNQVEGQLDLARQARSTDDTDLKFVASTVTQQGNGWFVQSMIYTKYYEEFATIRAMLGE